MSGHSPLLPKHSPFTTSTRQRPASATAVAKYFDTPGVLYELPIQNLTINVGVGIPLDVTSLLGSGRANYLLFQHLTAVCAGMTPGSEGGDSDLINRHGHKVEVKAFTDPTAYPKTTVYNEHIHTASSSTFPANNNGPVIKKLIADGNYAKALQLCRTTGYDKNDFYVYTNTRNYTAGVPFKYLILPKSTVLTLLSPTDPRTITRTALMNQVTRRHTIDAHTLAQVPHTVHAA